MMQQSTRVISAVLTPSVSTTNVSVKLASLEMEKPAQVCQFSLTKQNLGRT